MLILPLHKPLDRHTFPWATMLLVAINAFVFFAWQSGDDAALKRAQAYYLSSGLAGIEAPAYQRYLEQAGDARRLQRWRALPAAVRMMQAGRDTLTDVAFVRALRQGELLVDEEQAQAWRTMRWRYDALLAKVFTLRHIQRNSEWSLPRMFASAFLHGGVMHLLGNMLFLIALGLLLEGALGVLRFAVVYVLGIFGSATASALWHWGEAGAGLGASGAIAALMGAFCVVWGLRKVRFFYWFGVFFDYARAPAILLFPCWLGWEVWNLLHAKGSNVAFEAHAGGLLTGAVLGGLLVGLRQTRPGFMDEDEPAENAAQDDRLESAQRHMARMENAAAEHLLAELAAERPQDFDIARLRWRVAHNAGERRDLQQRSLQLLALPAHDATQRQAQIAATRELARDGIGLPPGRRAALVAQWCAQGALKDAEELLADAPRDMSEQEQAQAWLVLALRHGERGARHERTRLLQGLLQRLAHTPQADKARFLLENE